MRRSRHRSRCRCGGRSPATTDSPNVTTSPCRAVVGCIERYGATTRIRSNGSPAASRHAGADGGGVPPDHVPAGRPAVAHPCRDLLQGADRRRPLVGVGRPGVEEASNGRFGGHLPVGAARRAHRPVRGGIRGDRQGPGRDRRRPGRVAGAVLQTHRPGRRRLPGEAGRVLHPRGPGPDPEGTRRARPGSRRGHPRSTSPANGVADLRDTVARAKRRRSVSLPTTLVAGIDQAAAGATSSWSRCRVGR